MARSGSTTLRPSEVAKTLNVSRYAVYDLIKRGDLPAVRVGHQFRIDASSVAAYRDRGRQSITGVSVQSADLVLRLDNQAHVVSIPGDALTLPSTSLNIVTGSHGRIQRHRYRGVLLHTLLSHYGLLPSNDPEPGELDPAVCTAVVQTFLVARGHDGHVVVLGLAEIAPEYGGVPFLVTWERDNELMGEEALPHLVTPSDSLGGRSIRRLKSIEVRSVT